MQNNILLFLIIIFTAFGLSLVISLLSYFTTNNSPYKENTSVYECGFTPFNSPSAPFSINFFLVAVIFLIFDLEIVLLFPWSTTLIVLPLFSQGIVIAFIIMVILGLVYEWYNGALEW